MNACQSAFVCKYERGINFFYVFIFASGIRIRICIHVNACVNVCRCVQTYSHACAYILVCILTYAHKCNYAHIDACVHLRTFTHTFTRI